MMSARDTPSTRDAQSRIFAAVVSDVCDQLGYRHQTLRPGIRKVAGRGVLIGRARTARSARVESIPDDPYTGEIDFIDSLEGGDVVVADTGGSLDAFWGELFSAAAWARGCLGAVVDGYVRDVERIEPLSFSVYAQGAVPTDCLGRLRISSIDEPIDVGGVTVCSGDLIVADRDGVVVVPTEIAETVMALALDKASTENRALDEINRGSTLRAAWEKYRVL